MNLLPAIIHFVADDGGDTVTVDPKGIVTHSPIWPETSELIYGTIASLIIFALLFKYAGPPAMEFFRKRTERSRRTSTAPRATRPPRSTRPSRSVRPRATSPPSVTACSPRPAEQAAAMIVEGPSASTTSGRAACPRRGRDRRLQGRASATSCEPRSPTSPAQAAERAVAETLDDQNSQDLVESFIQEVGASA